MSLILSIKITDIFNNINSILIFYSIYDKIIEIIMSQYMSIIIVIYSIIIKLFQLFENTSKIAG